MGFRALCAALAVVAAVGSLARTAAVGAAGEPPPAAPWPRRPRVLVVGAGMNGAATALFLQDLLAHGRLLMGAAADPHGDGAGDRPADVVVAEAATVGGRVQAARLQWDPSRGQWRRCANADDAGAEVASEGQEGDAA